MSVLDEWDKEATCTIPDCSCETDWNRKIKALIDLVRRKDEVLKSISQDLGELRSRYKAQDALAFTEQLK